MPSSPGAALACSSPGAVCHALGANPSAVLASGALLATFPGGEAAAAVDELARRGHRMATIGWVEVGSGVRDIDGRPIAWPSRDEVARLLSP